MLSFLNVTFKLRSVKREGEREKERGKEGEKERAQPLLVFHCEYLYFKLVVCV